MVVPSGRGMLTGRDRAARTSHAERGRVRSVGPDGERFEEHRALLFSVAYRILGTRSDAEDVLQDAWLRWTGHGTVK